MPVFEMPLKDLEVYRGVNPRPADFDAYWKGALEELAATRDRVELEPEEQFSVPYAECFHLYFGGVGGARVHAKYLRPAGGRGLHPALLLFHGYSMSSGDWFDKLPYVALGFCVAALDCRGQGGLSQDAGGVAGTTLRGHIIRGLDDSPEKLLYRQVFLDTAQLARIVMGMEEVDAAKVAAMGASQGGGLTLACAALVPELWKAVAVYPFLCDYRRVWEMDLAERAYEELKDYFRRFDPTHQREREVFTRLGYIDVQHLAARIQAEVLMATALMDEICPPSTQFAAYNKIGSPKRMVLYPDFGHETLPGLADTALRFFNHA